MQRLTTLLCFLVLASACGSVVPSPTPLLSTSPTPLRMTSVEALVTPESAGSCILGATVEVVGGQSVGKSITLTDQCDIWGDSHGGEARFTDLIQDVPMTLRASATGYRAQERTVVPSWPGERVIFALSRIAEP